MSIPLELRFWAMTDIADPVSCWEWLGKRYPRENGRMGYGRIGVGPRRSVGAHRISWILAGNKIPKGKWVLHRCDNPGCVNPRHLFLGDAAMNVADMLAKKRWNMRGRNHPKAKLSDNAIRVIRSSRATCQELAARYSVTDTLISLVKLERIWRHVK